MTKRYIFFPILVVALILVFILSGCGSKNVKKAEDYMNAGMFEQALQLLQIEVQDNPKNAKAHYLLGVALLSIKSVRSAEEEFNRAILLKASYRDKVGEGYFRAAMGLFDKEDRSTAGEFLQEAVKNDPDIKDRITKSLFDRGIEMGNKDPESSKVLEYFTAAKYYDSKFNEEIGKFCYSTANSLIEKGSLIKAAEYAYVSAEFDPNFIKEGGKLLFKIGIELLKQGKVYEGQVTLNKALQRYPEYSENTADFVYYMAEYFYREENFSKSKELFQVVAKNFTTSHLADSAKNKIENWTVLKTVSLVIPANKMWTSTKIYLAPGTKLSISASGTISYGYGCGPDGNLNHIAGFGGIPIGGKPFGLLIGKIGTSGEPFPIGKTFAIDNIERGGELFLGINDTEYLDNMGYFTVQVKYRTKE